MEKFLDKLAYSDFVAHLFPGSISIALFSLILVELGIVSDFKTLIDSSINTILFFFLGYCWGIIQSGIAYVFESYNENPNDVRDIINGVNDDDALDAASKRIFFQQFGTKEFDVENWNSQYFLGLS